MLYQAGTEPGSSGSPVLKVVDRHLVIVALHKGGKDKAEGHLGYNYGSHFSEILKSVNNKNFLDSTCCTCTKHTPLKIQYMVRDTHCLILRHPKML